MVGYIMPFNSGGWATINAALFTIVAAELVHYGRHRLQISAAIMTEESISNRIRALRFHNGKMSHAELGHRIGVTLQTVAIEAGKYSPSLEAAFRIAQVFNVPLEEVF